MTMRDSVLCVLAYTHVCVCTCVWVERECVWMRVYLGDNVCYMCINIHVCMYVCVQRDSERCTRVTMRERILYVY